MANALRCAAETRSQRDLGPGAIATPAVADSVVVVATGRDDDTVALVLVALGVATGWRHS
jgi:adenosylcobinamide amidohydrolase